MNGLLKRLGLTDSFSIELRTSPDDLTKYLNDITGQFGLLDIFSLDDKEFKGEIRSDEFQIEGKASLFSTITWAAAYGQIIKSADKLVINVDVRANYIYFFLISFCITSFLFITLGLTLAVGEFLNGDYKDGFFALFFFGLLFLFVDLYPIWRMRWGVLNLRYDLEKELTKLKKATLDMNAYSRQHRV